MQTRRLPASRAGPAPERLFLGSGRRAGVFSEAWLRLQKRPHLRSTASVHFADIAGAVAATQAVAQSGLFLATAGSWIAAKRCWPRGDAANAASGV